MRRNPLATLVAIEAAEFDRERAVLLGLEAERADIVRRRDAARGHVAAAIEAAGEGAHVAFYGGLTEGGRTALLRVEAALESLDRKILAQREVVRARRVEHRRYESLCERRLDADRAEAERREARERDELAVLRHAHRQRAHGA